MRICIDPGHGMGNRTPGLYDPGAIHIEGSVRFEEASIALDYAKVLAQALAVRGHEVMLTRGDDRNPCPVWKRAARAVLWKADLLVSLHINDADDDRANGLEVLYGGKDSSLLAEQLQQALVAVTGFRDRGIKLRDLAVFRSTVPAVLIELGFIAHDQNRARLLDPTMRLRVCSTIAETVVAWKRGA